MSLLGPVSKVPISPAERFFLDSRKKKRSMIKWTIAILIFVGICIADPGWLPFLKLWAPIRLLRTVLFFLWKYKNADLIKEGECIVKQKEKQAIKEAERIAKLKAISGDLPPEELYEAVKKQAENATKAVKGLPFDGTKLVNIIEHNVNEIRRITTYLAKLEEYIEEENPALLAKEKTAVIAQLKSTDDAMIRNQLQSSLELLERRITESEELLLEEKRLKSKITTFQQAIESIRSSATRFEASLVDGDDPKVTEDKTARAIANMEQEFELMRKVQAEIESVTSSESHLEEELRHLREENRAKQQKAAQLGVGA